MENKVLFDKAEEVAEKYESGYYLGLENSLVNAKEWAGPINEICALMEDERKQTEYEILKSIDLDIVGEVLTSYFEHSTFCTDSKNYTRFDRLRKSLAYTIGYNGQSDEIKDAMDEIGALSCCMDSIVNIVKYNEQYLKDNIIELDTPLYETYRGRIIYSGNTVCQIVIDFLGMSYFTNKVDVYEVIKERHDYLLTLVEM
jgi:hypothetical protein